jgi:L-lysine 2,3-aminomutase
MEDLVGQISGFAVPHYAIDAPGGKEDPDLPPLPPTRSIRTVVLRNYEGRICRNCPLRTDTLQWRLHCLQVAAIRGG